VEGLVLELDAAYSGSSPASPDQSPQAQELIYVDIDTFLATFLATFLSVISCLRSSNLATNPFKFLHKRCDFLKNALLLRQVLRIERTHFGKNGVELGAILAGKLSS